MCKIQKISTKDMSREEWLKHRRGSIGGSDAGAILGLNQYRSPFALWAEKTGKVIPEDISDKEAVRLGNDLEQYVAERWMEATGKKLRRENNILYNPDYPWAHANIDRAVIGEPDALFEAKTTSSFDILAKCREGKYPDTWYCQVTHYMMVTGAKRAYLGVLCLGHGFFHYTIERNEEEIAALAAVERRFWEQVQNGTPPAVDGAESTMDTLKTMYADSDGSSVDLSGYVYDLTIITEMDKQIKELEAMKEASKARVMQFMGSAEKGAASRYTVTWKNQTRNTFDKAAFERDHGTIPASYYKQSTSRVFRLTEKKGT